MGWIPLEVRSWYRGPALLKWDIKKMKEKAHSVLIWPYYMLSRQWVQKHQTHHISTLRAIFNRIYAIGKKGQVFQSHATLVLP